jgi:Putative zinc-finger
MNRELPKPMLDALAREATPAAHPPPDVLAAFMERTLSGRDKQRVTEHLARCTDCREVVFLASSAAEEPVAEEQDWLAAAGVPRLSPALQTQARARQAIASASPSGVPWRRWAPRWVWAVPVAAALLVLAGLLIQQRFFAVLSAPQLASKGAINSPGPPPPESQQVAAGRPAAESSATRPAREMRTKTARAKSDLSKSHDAIGLVPEPSTVAQQQSAVPAVSRRNEVQEPAAIAIGGMAGEVAPAAPRVNSFVASEAGRAAAVGGPATELYATPQVSVRGANASHPQWRVTAEGQLEHSTQVGWTRVLANQTTGFRAVSVIGNDVWAGGDGGALFHSSDKGQQWGRVSVVTSGVTVTATIVSIQFDDPQNGVVITESGLRCSTSDGGLTWTSQ